MGTKTVTRWNFDLHRLVENVFLAYKIDKRLMEIYCNRRKSINIDRKHSFKVDTYCWKKTDPNCSRRTLIALFS